MNEKVYITRDEDSDNIFVWRKPTKGNWSPSPIKDCEMVSYTREEVTPSSVDYYLVKDFKKKFGMTIRAKTKKCVHLDVSLLNNEDYKLISNDKNRKQ